MVPEEHVEAVRDLQANNSMVVPTGEPMVNREVGLTLARSVNFPS